VILAGKNRPPTAIFNALFHFTPRQPIPLPRFLNREIEWGSGVTFDLSMPAKKGGKKKTATNKAVNGERSYPKTRSSRAGLQFPVEEGGVNALLDIILRRILFQASMDGDHVRREFLG
jgi:hypothetical protein